jgi:hypothetical protein
VADELQEISPFLGNLKKENPFTVPAGYFENLVPEINRPQQTPAKVIRLSAAKRFYRYAAAAVIAGIFGITAILMFNQKSDNTTLALNQDSVTQSDLEQKVNALTDEEIADFIEGISITAYDNPVGGGEINEEEVRLMLADISDKELEKYLDTENPMKEKFN